MTQTLIYVLCSLETTAITAIFLPTNGKIEVAVCWSSVLSLVPFAVTQLFGLYNSTQVIFITPGANAGLSRSPFLSFALRLFFGYCSIPLYGTWCYPLSKSRELLLLLYFKIWPTWHSWNCALKTVVFRRLI